MTFTTDQIANGSKTLMEEVAANKVTGEEEYWSRTDLHDFQGNIEGARVAFEGLQPLLQKRNSGLSSQIETRFADLQALLDHQRTSSGFRSYDAIATADVKSLAAAVDALAEPLSKLTSAVI